MDSRDYPDWIKRYGEAVAPKPVKPCAGCTACCHLPGVAEIGLKPFERCRHERGFPWVPGCGIYADRPSSCRRWSCQYGLEGWDDELRPDRCGVVVGPEPDLFRLRDATTGELHDVPAIQMWAAPGFEEAYLKQPVLAVVLAAIDGGAAVLFRYRRPEDGVPVGLSIGKHNGEIYRTAPAEVHAGFTASMSEGERTRKANALLKGKRR
ncbi:MAG TPA: hypothetical protein VLL82_12395 [Mycobacterium sp.]|nr:hypothetical protein [Mycobacterium sp.]